MFNTFGVTKPMGTLSQGAPLASARRPWATVFNRFAVFECWRLHNPLVQQGVTEALYDSHGLNAHGEWRNLGVAAALLERWGYWRISRLDEFWYGPIASCGTFYVLAIAIAKTAEIILSRGSRLRLV